MPRFGYRLAISGILAFVGLASSAALAAAATKGYWEISANGSYFKVNNGILDGEQSRTTTIKFGGGLAYRFAGSTSIEFAYVHSKVRDRFGQNISGQPEIYFIDRRTSFENYSMNLVLNFSDRKSTFRPYIRGGGGYMVRKARFAGTAKNRFDLTTRKLSFATVPTSYSVSADGGLGFSLFVLDQIALDFSYTVYATDLDKPQVFLHYSVAGGLRFVF